MQPTQERFSLPMTATFSVGKNGQGQYVAHALDFDLVSVAPSETEATDKLRFAVKTYIEFGIANQLSDAIRRPAPKEFWDSIKQNKLITWLPPIEIDDTMVLVFESRTDETRQAA